MQKTKLGEEDFLLPKGRLEGSSPGRGPWLLGQVACVAIFVVFGSGQAIATRASATESGGLPYDSSAAVLVAEVVKLSVSAAWVLVFDRDKLASPSRRWLWQSADLSIVAGLFALQNQLNFLVIAELGSGLFMILGNLKIVFTCIFMTTLLGKRFARLQWLAVFLLTCSAVVVKVPLFIKGSVPNSTVVGLGLLLVATVSSGLAAVKNELIVKGLGAHDGEKDGEPMPFMLQNFVLYTWGVAINGLSWLAWGKHAFLFQGFNAACWVSVGCLVTFGLACAIMLKYLDNVVRCFSGVAQVLFTVVLSHCFASSVNEGHFDQYHTFSLALLAVALSLYQAHDSSQLPIIITASVAAALLVGIACSYVLA